MNQKQPHQDQKRILAVDDEPDLTTICSLALEHYGFKVDTFNDSNEALSRFKPDYYDLVNLDIKIPKMYGFELYNELKKRNSNVKVCFLTASELYYK
jgi:DNA-binding response OmpR family regulator